MSVNCDHSQGLLYKNIIYKKYIVDWKSPDIVMCVNCTEEFHCSQKCPFVVLDNTGRVQSWCHHKDIIKSRLPDGCSFANDVIIYKCMGCSSTFIKRSQC